MHIQGKNDPKRTAVRAALLSLVSLVATMGCIGALPGCVGAGDDNAVAMIASDGGDAGDARTAGDAGDAKPPDARASDAASGDAGVKDTGSAADAITMADGTVAPASGGVAVFNSSPIDFGLIGCNSVSAQTFAIKNTGTATLIIAASATTAGTATGSFSLDRTSLSVDPGTSQSLSIAATIPATAAAGSVLQGSLALITTDRNNARVSIPLSATAMGATLVLPGGGGPVFPATKVGTAAAPVPFVLQNVGNGPATVTISPPSTPDFSLSGVGGAGLTKDLAANGGEIQLTAGYTPSQGTSQDGTSTFAITGTTPTCGTSVASVRLAGTGTVGSIVDYPSTLAFSANCGGQAPAPVPFTLRNVGSVPVQVNLQVDPADAGFSVTPSTASIPAGSSLSPEGGTSTFQVSAPPFPAQTGDGGTDAGSMPSPAKATLKLPSDANNPIPNIALTENPQGASLVFVVAGSAGASQGLVLNSPVGATKAQSFGVVNNGTGTPADVTLRLVPAAPPDAGSPADGSVVAGAPGPFTFDTGTVATQLRVPPGAQGANANITFAPVAGVDSFASVVMSVPPTAVLCAQLPLPLPVQGHGSGLGVDPTSLTLYATCDGRPVPSEQFPITNTSTNPLPWAIGSITGPGAANYAVTAISVTDTTTAKTTPLMQPFANTPRSLASTEIAIVTVAVTQPMRSAAATDGGAPWTAPSPAELAASLNVDSSAGGAVILLNEIPVGDRLSVSLGSQNSVPITSMAFGLVPVHTKSSAQPFVITNEANPAPGSYTGANVSITVSGDAAFAVSPSPPTSPLLPGGSSPETVTFSPVSEGPSVGMTTIAVTQADPTAPLCAPLPSPIALSGTGTQAVAVVSPTTHDFGPVLCGSAAIAPAQFTVSNPAATSNLPFTVTSLAFTNPSSPYALQPAPDLSMPVAVGGSLAFTVIAKPLPTTGVDPINPGTAFTDTLTVNTSIAGAAGTFPITLTLQPKGAVIADTVPPLRTMWNFGAVAFGSTGTIFSLIDNTGNAPATVTLAASMDAGAPQLLPAVFDLAPNPTSAPPGVTSIQGRFTPSASSGSWVGQATLTVSGPLCQALPAQWVSPTIQLSGNSP